MQIIKGFLTLVFIGFLGFIIYNLFLVGLLVNAVSKHDSKEYQWNNFTCKNEYFYNIRPTYLYRYNFDSHSASANNEYQLETDKYNLKTLLDNHDAIQLKTYPIGTRFQFISIFTHVGFSSGGISHFLIEDEWGIRSLISTSDIDTKNCTFDIFLKYKEYWPDGNRTHVSQIEKDKNFQEHPTNYNFRNDKVYLNKISHMLDKNSSKNMDDFTAYHVALNYNEKSYSVMMSAELREGINKKKVNLSTALYTQSNDSLAMALGGKLNKSKTKESDETDINAHISMAYRPNSANVIMLEKFEYRSSNSMIENKNLKSEKLINNFNINLSPTRNSELALQYGAKYVFDSIDSFEHKGVTQLFGLDASYDLTDSWKFGLQGSCLYAQSANNFDYGFGVYSGHNLFDNMLLTIGYNWKGFEDEDFSLQTYRLEGAYFRFNMKFDQESLKNSLKMMSW